MQSAGKFQSPEFFKRPKTDGPSGAWELYTFPDGVFDANAIIHPGWQLHFLQRGTSIYLPTYADSAATIKHGNPLVIDRYGNFPTIYTNNLYDYEVSIRNEYGVERYTAE